MGHDNNSSAVRAEEDVEHLISSPGIQLTSRFIGENQLGRGGERSRDDYALRFSSRKDADRHGLSVPQSDPMKFPPGDTERFTPPTPATERTHSDVVDDRAVRKNVHRLQDPGDGRDAAFSASTADAAAPRAREPAEYRQ